ncbi:hypothetical protein C8R47DRAFT_1231256 [Mycena vitilis]|nr:hypothetical protein C8R47DRAFT_1231256 [Mycena vitilis]
MSILASIAPSDLHPGEEKTDDDGRILSRYVDHEGTPVRVLLIGKLLAVNDLDEGLRVHLLSPKTWLALTVLPQLLVLGPPDAASPLTRAMFSDQHAVLEAVVDRERPEVLRFVLNQQVWSQGTPALPDGIVFVRISADTVLDVSNLSADSHLEPFVSFAPEVPPPGADGSPLAKGSLVVCSADMFRVDVPVPAMNGKSQELYARAYGLNASSAIRFVRRA